MRATSISGRPHHLPFGYHDHEKSSPRRAPAQLKTWLRGRVVGLARDQEGESSKEILRVPEIVKKVARDPNVAKEPAFLGKFATAAALDVVTTVSVLVPLLRELGERANKSGADGAFGMTADGKRTRDGSFISFPVPSAADSPSSSLDERLELPQTAAKSTSEGTDGDLDGKLAAGVGGSSALGEALEEGQRGENAAIAAEMDAEETTAEETAITGEMDAEETTAEETAIAAAIAQAKMEAAEEEAAIAAEIAQAKMEAAEGEAAIAAAIAQAKMEAAEEEAAITAEMEKVEREAAEEEEAIAAEVEQAEMAATEEEAAVAAEVKQAETAAAEEEEAREARKETAAAARVAMDALAKQAVKAAEAAEAARDEAATLAYKARESERATGAASGEGEDGSHRDDSQLTSGDRVTPARSPDALPQVRLSFGPDVPPPPSPEPAPRAQPPSADADADAAPTRSPARDAAPAYSSASPSAGPPGPRGESPSAEKDAERDLEPASLPEAVASLALGESEGGEAPGMTDPPVAVGAGVLVPAIAWAMDSGFLRTADPVGFSILQLVSLSAALSASLSVVAAALHVPRCIGPVAVVSGVIPALLATSVSPKAQAAATLMGFAACSGFLEEVMLRDARTRLKLATHFVIIAGAAAGVFYAVSRMAGGVLSPPGVGIMDWVAVTGNAVDGGGIGIATGARGAALVSVVVTGLVAVLFRAAGRISGVRPSVLAVMLIGAAVVVGPFEPTLLAVLASSAGAYLGASLAGTTRGWGTVGPSGTVAAGAVIAACCAMAAMQGGALVLGLGVLVQAAVGRALRAPILAATGRYVVALMAVSCAMLLTGTMNPPVLFA